MGEVGDVVKEEVDGMRNADGVAIFEEGTGELGEAIGMVVEIVDRGGDSGRTRVGGADTGGGGLGARGADPSGDDFIHIGVDIERGRAGGGSLDNRHAKGVVATRNQDVEVGLCDTGVNLGERFGAMKSNTEPVAHGVIASASEVWAATIKSSTVGRPD